MSDDVDPLDTARLVDELEQRVGRATDDMPAPPTSRESIGAVAVPDKDGDVPGTPEPPD